MQLQIRGTLPHLRHAHCLLFGSCPVLSSDLASVPQLSTFPAYIASPNKFPTAAGLACSASGFLALVAFLAALYKLPATSQYSFIAHQSSGLACCSLFGGSVTWEMDSELDGFCSLAIGIAPCEYWPDVFARICVVSDDKGSTPSTSGMQRAVGKSALL